MIVIKQNIGSSIHTIKLTLNTISKTLLKPNMAITARIHTFPSSKTRVEVSLSKYSQDQNDQVLINKYSNYLRTSGKEEHRR